MFFNSYFLGPFLPLGKFVGTVKYNFQFLKAKTYWVYWQHGLYINFRFCLLILLDIK
jgi:hypothetical protein